MLRRVAAGVCVLLWCVAPNAHAQTPVTAVRVEVKSAAGSVAGAEVTIGAQTQTTPADGVVTIPVTAGDVTIVVTAEAFARQQKTLTVPAGVTLPVTIELAVDVDVDEEVTVSATRAGKRVQDEPLRVEVLSRDEIEEKLMMTPGDIAMMLNETAGLRVQVTSPSLGAASLRMQGLRGRYTQLLSDGLPLYGGQSGSIGLLQIPPMDLSRVEIVKGVASSLFGSSALGGVINLVSRQPKPDAEREVLVNQTTLGGTDAVLWLSGPLAPRWSYSLLANADRQSKRDVDGDGWTDLPGFSRVNLRPRVFWNNGQGQSVFFTAGFMGETREGGTMPGRVAPDGRAFREALDSRRFDAGLVGRFIVMGERVLGVRGSAAVQQHDHVFGDAPETDRHATGFGEVSLTGTTGAHVWVIGGALQSDDYRSVTLPRFNYQHVVPSVFAQDDYTFSPALAVSISARLDRHNQFGTFLSPRLSALVKPAPGWTIRMSGGTGYFAPTPLTDETDAVGLTRMVSGLPTTAERARSYSLDVNRVFGGLELNATVFGSRVTGALAVQPVSAATYALVTRPGPTTTIGAEALAKMHVQDFSIVATYTLTRSTEMDPATATRNDVPLTPMHAAGVVAAWEREGAGRAGLEIYVTGPQRLEDNPYRTRSPRYVYLGAMIERRIHSRLRVFINAENLADRRQTRVDPLVRPSRNFDGRWTVDAWGPLDGRVINAGIRWMF